VSAGRGPESRPRPWAVLWLWLAVPFLLLGAVLACLPMAFEESPADRVVAAASLRPVVLALLAIAALAAAAGWVAARLARRGRAESAGPPPS